MKFTAIKLFNKICFFFFLILFISCNKKSEKQNKYSIEDFYKSSKIRGGTFSTDGSKLLISSNASGIFNAFEIDIATGNKEQKTNSTKNSYFAVSYLPNSNEIIYSADKGGNEITHLYLLKEDGTSVDLTPSLKEKASFLKWSEDNKHLFYTSNKRNPKFFDLYKMKIKDWSSKVIYENKNNLDFVAVSNNEKLFLLSKNITRNENKLFLKENNTTIEISDKLAAYKGYGFSKDNEYLYYTTNADSEFYYLVSYHVKTKKRTTIYKTNWNVVNCKLSKKDKYLAITTNEDGKNKTIVLDNSTKKPIELPKIQEGTIEHIAFSNNENKLKLTVSSSKQPRNIYTYNIEEKQLKKQTNTLNKAINANDLVTAKIIRYPSFDGVTIPAIYYEPKNANKNNKVPALIWVHGGPGGQSKASYFSLFQYLVNNGYAILAVNNRGSSGYGKTFYSMDDRNHGEKDLNDCIWGKKWLQKQPNINKDEIGIMGASYGGYMTMAAMTSTPDEFKVGVNIFGVTNWIRTLRSIPPYWETFKKGLYKELGDPYTKDSIRLRKISPLFHAKKVKNPIMVLQGSNDPRVLQIESDELVAAVKKNNIPVEYIIFPDEGHGFVKKKNEIKGYKAVKTFLDKYLKQ